MIVSTTIAAVLVRRFVKKYRKKGFFKKKQVGNSDFTEVEFLGI